MCLYLFKRSRPSYELKKLDTMSSSDSETYSEKPIIALPPELSFEAVLADRTLPPYCLQDFMDYLLHISHHAENLQFYLWLRDYTARFSAALAHERALSPPWEAAKHGDSTAAGSRVWENADGRERSSRVDVDTKVTEVSPLSEKASFRDWNPSPVVEGRPKGLKWQPFSIQPFRDEIQDIIALYLTPGSSRELNLSEKDRVACLHALQHTTHPSAFAIPMREITETLLNYSHPNFIRWADADTTRPRRKRRSRLSWVYDVLRTAVKSRPSSRWHGGEDLMQDEVYHVWRK